MAARDKTQDSLTNDPAAAFGQNLAVVIGINAYDHGIPALRSAVNDARKFGEILEAEHRFSTMIFLDEQATKVKLLTLFTETLPAQISEQIVYSFILRDMGLQSTVKKVRLVA